jgi:hypothetical protein
LNYLKPWELIDKQLNASALHLIHMSLSEKDKGVHSQHHLRQGRLGCSHEPLYRQQEHSRVQV